MKPENQASSRGGSQGRSWLLGLCCRLWEGLCSDGQQGVLEISQSPLQQIVTRCLLATRCPWALGAPWRKRWLDRTLGWSLKINEPHRCGRQRALPSKPDSHLLLLSSSGFIVLIPCFPPGEACGYSRELKDSFETILYIVRGRDGGSQWVFCFVTGL